MWSQFIRQTKNMKKRERCCIGTLKTMKSYGLNIVDSLQSAHTLLRSFPGYYFSCIIILLLSAFIHL